MSVTAQSSIHLTVLESLPCTNRREEVQALVQETLEEEKSELEPLRVWGHVYDAKGEIVPATAPKITA